MSDHHFIKKIFAVYPILRAETEIPHQLRVPSKNPAQTLTTPNHVHFPNSHAIHEFLAMVLCLALYVPPCSSFGTVRMKIMVVLSVQVLKVYSYSRDIS